MLNLSDKQRGESAFFTLGISAKNISFPFANWSAGPHGRQLVVCLMESFTPRFHISCSVFPGGLNQKKKSYTSTHTRILTRRKVGWEIQQPPLATLKSFDLFEAFFLLR